MLGVIAIIGLGFYAFEILNWERDLETGVECRFGHV